jgi:hypothetical protein
MSAAFNLYGQTARFDGSARALTVEEMRKQAPSIFAVDAHESRSQRFRPIPTFDVLKGLEKEGWSPVAVSQNRTRMADRREFTKHQIRLRRLNDGTKYQVGDNVLEMRLQNANDGTSRYVLLAGIFRIRCLNSLVSDNGHVDEVKVGHTGNVVDKVIEGTYRVLNEAETYLKAPQDWSQIKLNRDEALAFADAAHQIRFEDETTAIQPGQLLIPRRPDDREPNLWNVFNVVQENAVRGGLTGINVNQRRVTTREVKAIDGETKLNRALWRLTQTMAELKAA